MTIDGTKEQTVFFSEHVKPTEQCTHGAHFVIGLKDDSLLKAFSVLVRLRSPQGDDQAGPLLPNVLNPETSEFGASECTVKAQQEDRSIADPPGAIVQRTEGLPQIRAPQGCGLFRASTFLSADALENSANSEVRPRLIQAGLTVGSVDRTQTNPDRACR